MYGSVCQPSWSYSQSFGYHWVIEYSTPSLFIQPLRRICRGTCAVHSNSNVAFLPALMALLRVTSSKVPSCSKATGFPLTLSEATSIHPHSSSGNSKMREPTRRSGSLMVRERTSIMLPGWNALKNRWKYALSSDSGLLFRSTTFMEPLYWWAAVSTVMSIV